MDNLRNKIIAAEGWITVAFAMIFLSQPGTGDGFKAFEFQKIIPRYSELATSPIANKHLNENLAAKENFPTFEGRGVDRIAAVAEKNVSGTQAAGNTILIPKIGAQVPIVTANTIDTGKLHKLLDSGAVMYPGSVSFGQIGQTVLLGHSAPANWPTIKHDTAFSRISELILGDSIEITYGNRRYNYSVTKKQVIDKGGDFSGAPIKGSVLVLVSCWPPGRDFQRLAVEAILIDK